MVQSKLSDEEMNTIMALSARGEHVGVVKYVNQLLYQKSLGDDLCARPLAFRNRADQNKTCFAVGYLEKVESFMVETNARSPKMVVPDTVKLIAGMKSEISKFFSKEDSDGR